MRLRTLNLLLLLVLLTAGCGGEDASDEAAKPTLSPAVATRLASASDAVAEAFESGDVCTAAGRADELQNAVAEAINAGQVPPAFQEELMSRAQELVNEVNCPPPPPTTTEDEDDEDEDKGKGKGRKKKDEEVVTVPPPTEIPTDTTGGPGDG